MSDDSKSHTAIDQFDLALGQPSARKTASAVGDSDSGVGYRLDGGARRSSQLNDLPTRTLEKTMKPTRNQVIAVIKEFEKRGPENFLALYGYRESTKYDLLLEGHSYPPKAIYNVALKRASGEDDKSGIAVGLGGGKAVNEPLTLLRFKIVSKNKQDIGLDVPDAAVDDYAERSIGIRRGQPKFRSILLEQYERSCAVTSCSVAALLDACHVKPYSDFADYDPSNGILLRTDIHTLFDLNLIKIHPKSRRIQVDKSIKDDTYQELNGSIVRKPKSKIAELNGKYLEERWKRNVLS